jgi:hypothetical protein
MRTIGFFPIVVSAMVLSAQSGIYVASAGYAFPELVPVAPGQVISLFLRGVYAPTAKAGPGPLPTTLSGIAVEVLHTPAPGFPTSLPIVAVWSSRDRCGGGIASMCDTTNVVVQFPFEPTCVKTGRIPNECTIGGHWPIPIVVKVNGVASQQFSFSPVVQAPHFLDTCDSIFTSPPVICSQALAHADGSWIGPPQNQGFTPAHPGELITIQATGLGRTPHAKTGQTLADPDPLPVDILLTPAFRIGTESQSQFMLSNQAIKAESAVLAAGTVGIYNITVRLPEPPAGVRPCGKMYDGPNLRLLLGQRVSDPDSQPFANVCVAAH